MLNVESMSDYLRVLDRRRVRGLHMHVQVVSGTNR